MSTSATAEDRPRREVAYRVFATEYEDATLSHSESDEERAPNYVITPTGARVNRLFVVGVLTECEWVSDDVLRARIADPTGAFVLYAGQYQPEALAYLEGAEPPQFVAVTGKARTFQPEDADVVYTSIRPESLSDVDADTRDRWVVQTAEQTIDRIGTYARAAALDARDDVLTTALLDAGVEYGLANGVALAQDHYGTTPAYLDELREAALDAARIVAGERDSVRSPTLSPGDSGEGVSTFATLAPLAQIDVDDEAVAGASAAVADEPSAEASAGASAAADDASAATEDGTAASEAGAATSEPASEDSAASDAATAAADDEAVAADESTDVDEETTAAESSAAADDSTSTDDLGDFEGGGLTDELYEMDDEERAEIEAEYGAEFSTGNEVDGPGEAGIDVESSDDEDEEAPPEEDEAVEEEPPEEVDEVEEVDDDEEVDEPTEADEVDEDAAKVEGEPDEDEEEVEAAAAETEPDEDDEAAEADVDLDDALMAAMRDLDEGDGADREALIERVTDETGASVDAVEDAIQDALMGGQCYEPDGDTLKPI